MLGLLRIAHHVLNHMNSCIVSLQFPKRRKPNKERHTLDGRCSLMRRGGRRLCWQRPRSVDRQRMGRKFLTAEDETACYVTIKQQLALLNFII